MIHQSSLIPSLTVSNIVAALFFYITVYFIISILCAPRYPTNIPWAGHGNGWIAGLKNTFAAVTQSHAWIKHGYDTYNKHGRAYVLPSTFGMRKEIVIPRSQMQWMLEQPDSVLSVQEAHYELLNGDYSFIHAKILKDPYHERVLHKNLARNVNDLIPPLAEEIEFNMPQVLGLDTNQWKSVNIMNMFIGVVPRITNRILTGEVLCRNQTFINICVAFTSDVVRNIFLFAFMPKAIKGVVGPLAALPAKYHFRQSTRFTYPVIEKRMDDIRRKDAGENKEWVEPNDYMSWHIRTAAAEGRWEMNTVKRIAQSFLLLNFASVHTTALTGHSAIIDILSADPKFDVIATLREEAERIYHEEGQQWTKNGLARMYKIDSAIRESMRFSPFVTTQVARKVIAPEGITNPHEGWHAPYGAFISCPQGNVSYDADLVDHPEAYDPYRFSREREEYEARPNEEKGAAEGLRLRATGMVTTSDKHFAFGHGRHACPGRFFVAHELKLIIAYIVMNYDVKPYKEKPKPIWIGRNMLPLEKACLEVKRRTS